MRSMTGYGTAEGKVGKGVLFIEIKSVNHRFSDFSIKIPPRMGVLESLIRGKLQPKFDRGKVDVFFKEKEQLFGGVSISIDMELALKYHRAILKLRKQLGIKGDGDFFGAVGLDRIMHLKENDGHYEKLWGQISTLIDKAVKQVVQMQFKEGLHIMRDQKQRIVKLEKTIARIKGQSGHVLGQHFEKVRRKVVGKQNGGVVDEQRVQMEVALLGGRQDIAEELTRLESHIKQYSGLIKLKEPVGRKLDFLLQEMNRETNTIGAKAADAKISQLVVDCKTEVERLKEQIQNVV